MLERTYRPGTLTMLECRFNKTTHHVIIISVNLEKEEEEEEKGRESSDGLCFVTF